MDSDRTASEVRAFFKAYFEAYRRFDVNAIAELFAYPSFVTSDAQEVALIPFSTPEQCIKGVQTVLSLHRKLGSLQGFVNELTITTLSPRLAQAFYRGELRDGEQKLYNFDAAYSVAKIQGTWRITAIAHNQIPRLLACVAARTGGV